MSTGLIIGAFFLGILVVLILITFHELGHFVIAKISGAYVYEFAIGFGPRILTFKGKETWISLRIFPLGGFVSIASDDAEPPKGREDEIVPDERKMEYLARWKKAFFIVFGPIMNFLIAVIIVTTVMMTTMQKTNDLNFYGQRLSETGIAYKLINEQEHIGDNVQDYAITGWKTQVNGKKLSEKNWGRQKAVTYKTIVYSFLDEFKRSEYELTAGQQGQIQFSYALVDKYDGTLGKVKETRPSKITDKWNFNGKKTTVGISAPTHYYKTLGQAYGAGWKQVGEDSISLLKAFGMLFTGHINQLAGPIGVANQTAQMIQTPSTFFLYVGSISANLFMLNMIPIPPLDGFKFLENAVEAVTRKELNKKAKYVVYAAGALLFVGLFITITIKDIVLG